MAQKGAIFEFLLNQQRVATGSLAGGYAHFYEVGGTTPKAIWLDRDKATPAANPYQLDANGTAQLYGDGLYRIVIKDSESVTRYDRDNMRFTDLISSGVELNAADYASLAAAVAAIGSTVATLVVSTPQTVTDNLTTPVTLSLRVLNTGVITIASGKVLTINGPFLASGQVFDGSGTVAGLKEVKPEYFVTNTAPGTTDMTAAIQKSINMRVPVVLDLTKYLVTDTLNFYPGTTLIGQNKEPGRPGNPVESRTRIIFSPSSAKNLFNMYTNTDGEVYQYKPSISGIDVTGNANAQYALFGRFADGVFNNILIDGFQIGIYLEETMLNKFYNINIYNTTVAGIQTGESFNTSASFYSVYIGSGVWGAILKNALGFTFTNCVFESLSTGGINAYRGFGTVDIIGGYAEDVPNSAAGTNYGMFYVANTTAVASNGMRFKVLGGKWHGSNGTVYGSFLDVKYLSTTSGAADRVTILGANYGRYTNGIKVDATYTTSNAVFVAGNSSESISNQIVGDSTPDVTTNGYRVYGFVETSSGSISTSEVRATNATATSLTIRDPQYGYAVQNARSSTFTVGASQEIGFSSSRPALLQITASDGVSIHAAGLFAISYITSTDTCVVTQLSGTANMAITNTASKLCVYPTGVGAGTVSVANNLAASVVVTIATIK